MLPTETMRVERWETPFTDARDPSVGVIVEADEVGADALTLVVAPSGLDKYPKYLVRFASVVAFTCREEAFAPEIVGIDGVPFEDRRASAHLWMGSPWVESYRKGGPLVPAAGDGDLRHYLVFGGDNTVEVVTSAEPEVEEVTASRMLVARHAV